MDSNLKEKEIFELRLKCLEIFVTVASKHSIEKKEVFDLAEEAWKFANKPLQENPKGTPAVKRIHKDQT